MRLRRAWCAVLSSVLLVGLGACGEPPGDGAGVVVIDLPLTVADLTSVTYEISGAGITTPMTGTLTRSGASASGTVGGVPAGTGRLVKVSALAGTVEVCTGSTTVDVVQNQSVTATLQLVCTDQLGAISIGAVFDRTRRPDLATATVTGAGITGAIVVPLSIGGGTLTGEVRQVPAGTGRSVTISTSSGGTVDCTGNTTVNVVAGQTATVSALVLTCAPGASGSISINGSLNFIPRIHTVTSSQPGAVTGASLTVSVVASDPDGDALQYAWADGSGSPSRFGSPTLGTSTWTPTGLAPGTYTLTVSVTDGITPVASSGVQVVVGSGATITWLNLQAPGTATSALGTDTTFYAQLFIDGVTNPAGQAPGVVAQVGYGPDGVNPSTSPASFTWVPATFNATASAPGNNDEYQAALRPLQTGTYRVCSRFSTNGGATWTYGDLDGLGNGFSTGAMATLTVN